MKGMEAWNAAIYGVRHNLVTEQQQKHKQLRHLLNISKLTVPESMPTLMSPQVPEQGHRLASSLVPSLSALFF